MATRSKAAPSRSPRTEKPGTYKCVRCNRSYDVRKGNYYETGSDAYVQNDYFLPWCKHCINELYEDYAAKYHDERQAMRRICMLTDAYWSAAVFESCDVKRSARTAIDRYFAKLNTFQYRGMSYDDTIEEEGGLVVSVSEDGAGTAEGQEVVGDNSDDSVSHETVAFFGPGLTAAMYKELEQRYSDWEERLGGEIEDPGTMAIVKQICNLEMTINRDMAVGRSIDKNTNALNQLLASANLKPSQRKDETNPETEMTPFGVWISKIEDTRPISEVEPEFEDVDGIGKYVATWFLGAMCHVLKLNNKYSAFFEAEREKYTVEKPEYEGDDEDEDGIAEDIFEKARDRKTTE